MNAVRKLFRARKQQSEAPPPPAPAKRSRKKGLTWGEINEAIFAVCDVMAPCTARQTLEALSVISNVYHGAGEDSLVKVDGPAPVTISELDDALAEAQKFDLPAGTLSPLTRYRALLAQAEAKKAKEPVQYVTVTQLKAFEAAVYDVIGLVVGATAAEFNHNQTSSSHFLSMLGRSAKTTERRRMINAATEFKEEKVPQRTQAEWRHYQTHGRW